MVSTENATATSLAPVLARFDGAHRSATLVAGGYFESGVDEFSLNTFALAHRLGGAVRRMHRRNKVLYDVIHNDLGMVCGADACALPAAAGPVDLSPLLAAAKVDFTVTRERTLRNRATRTMKKWLKDPATDRRFVRDGDEIRYRSRSYEQVLAGVVKENHVVPRCPLIVNEYFTDYFARLRQFTFCEHRYVVDINSFADRDKILKGAEIYLRRANSPQETIIAVFVDAACRNLVELSLTRDDF
jgi:hypothetical protein